MTATENQPAAAVHALTFYNKLVELATLETIPDVSVAEMPEVLVFRGKLMNVFDSLSISSTFYSAIRRILIKYDCVTYIQRGTKSYDSVLVLNHPPPIENLTPEDLTRAVGDATLSAVAHRVADLEQEVEVLRAWRDSLGGLNLIEAMTNFERRLQKIEGKNKTGGSNGKT